MFKESEEAFYFVAFFVYFFVIFTHDFAISFWWNYDNRIRFLHEVDNFIGVITFICQ